MRRICPACRAPEPEPLVVVERSPVLTGVLCASEKQALLAPRRPLDLYLCGACGTVVNLGFDPGLIDYDGEYDNSLHFSGTFRAYAEGLARRLVDTHALAGRPIVEIGSGKGDFLRELCRLAGSPGIGYDPTYVGPERADDADVAFVVDYYGPRYRHLPADFVVCRHVLEHVEDPLGFLRNIRAALGERPAAMYLEVPNGGFMLSAAGVWDYIYPHVTYFSPAGLARVVTAAGFEVTASGTAFGDQFMWVEARTVPTADTVVPDTPAEISEQGDHPIPIGPFPGEDLAATCDYIDRGRRFGNTYREVVGRWSRQVLGANSPAARPDSRGVHNEVDRDGGVDGGAEIGSLEQGEGTGGVLVWGAGSKGVNFLNVLDPGSRVRGIVDLNPRKRGMFIPGTGHRVLGPDEVPGLTVERVLLLNPLYVDEVREMLADMGVGVEVVAVH